MSNEMTFPCIACGAPVIPEVNRDFMACSYCGTHLEIPRALRRKIELQKAGAHPTVTEPSAEINVPNVLRRAQPVAARALNLFFIWRWIRRIIPTCLILAIVFLIVCVVTVGLLAALGGK